MDKKRDIRAAQERQVRAVTRRPDVGRGTKTSRARLADGLTCQIEDGNWRFTTDLGKQDGGDESGPDPGTLARTALASCLVQIYVLWAARLAIPLEGVEVELETDFDIRGRLAVVEQPPGWRAIRFKTTIRSPAPEDRVREMVAIAERCSPILDDITRAVPVSGELNVLTTERVG